MGASHSVGVLMGQAVVSCGFSNTVGFERSCEAVIRSADIQPWPARALISARLMRQAELAKRSALRYISVRDGFNHFDGKVGRFTGLTRDTFLATAKNLIDSKNIHAGGEDELLLEIFDTIDYDGNGSLTVGEWAGGLTVFFKGTQDEKTQVLFELIDKDRSGDLSKSEMKEYLTPMVKAMTPPEAAALRPLLLQHATDQIFAEVDANNDGQCTTLEFQNWRKTHILIDELVKVIEGEVYRIWLDHKMRVSDNSARSGTKSPHHTDAEMQNSIYG